MNATPSSTPSDIDTLAKGLDGTLRQKAEAIAEFVDGRIGGLRNELTELVKKQGENVQIAKDSGKPEDAAIVNEGTRAVKDADQAVKAAEADPTPDKAADARDKVGKAAQAVDKTESELAGRVTRGERRLDGDNEPDSIEGIRRRVCDLEDNQSGFQARLEGVQAAAAHAIAIARSGEGGALRHASRVALTVFGLVGVTYWLLWWLTPLDYQWNINAGLALGAGGLAGWIALLWWGDDGAASASAGASASSHHGNQPHTQEDAGLGILDRAPHTTASAHAGAAASHH